MVGLAQAVISWVCRQKGTWVEVLYIAVLVLITLLIGADTADNLYAEF